MELSKNKENFKYGSLPDRGALASAYVPMQTEAVPAYEANDALSMGTLFPGLDLPFMNIVGNKLSKTPETELMAIDFAAHELELYLDTHREDREAFSMLQVFLSLQKEAHSRYNAMYGPLSHSAQLGMEKFSWLNEPWPWDYKEGL